MLAPNSQQERFKTLLGSFAQKIQTGSTHADLPDSFSDVLLKMGYSAIRRSMDGTPVFMSVANFGEFDADNWHHISNEFLAVLLGLPWVFGDLYNLGELHGIDPEQLAPIGKQKTIQNWATSAASNPIVATQELADMSGILKYLDMLSRGESELKSNGFPIGLMRFPQLDHSKHAIFNKLGGELAPYRAGLLLQAIAENWTVSDCTRNKNQVMNHLATIGNPTAQDYFKTRRIFPTPKTNRFSVPTLKPGMSRLEIYRALGPLVEKILDLPKEATEIMLDGKLSYILPPKESR